MDVPKDWWLTFFSGAAVDFWLHLTTEEQTQAEANFIQKMLQVSPPKRILDVPCGGGRHSLALAARGYGMTGVDVSPGFGSLAEEPFRFGSMRLLMTATKSG